MAKSTQFAWYSLVSKSEPLEQGDLLDQVPIVIPKLELLENSDSTTITSVDGELSFANAIVMTQSCDLERFGNDDVVAVCVREDIRKAEINGQSFNSNNKWSLLRKGYLIGAYLMNRCEIENHQFEYQVVDLRRVYTLPFAFVRAYVAQSEYRVRLLSPYREHLSQAYATLFMRVGLPIPLPEKRPKHLDE